MNANCWHKQKGKSTKIFTANISTEKPPRVKPLQIYSLLNFQFRWSYSRFALT